MTLDTSQPLFSHNLRTFMHLGKHGGGEVMLWDKEAGNI